MACLLADIGGTNARFGLLPEAGEVQDIAHFAVADFDSAESAMRHYLERSGTRPEGAVLAVAATVSGGRARLTNGTWSFDAARLAAALGLRWVELVNDFAAVARAIPRLEPRQLVELGGGGGEGDAPVAVLGPGTGLGAATLLPDGRVLVGEGGHVTLPAADDREAALLAILRRRFEHVSAERVVSGMGLVDLHEAVRELDGLTASGIEDAADVTAAAAAGDAPAQATLDAFFAFLGSVAGNMALVVGARGGVYLAGGILPRLVEPLLGSRFRERFEQKGRFRGYLESIPTKLIVEPDPAFLGLVAFAEDRRARD